MKKDKTIIEFTENSLDYIRQTESNIKNVRGYLILIISAFIIFISSVLFILQTANYDFFDQLAIFKRIKNNMSSWKSLILEKTGIEIARGKNLAARSNIKIFNFECYDMGTYYVSARLNERNGLPQFIKRGKGDVWMIRKADKIDNSSKQFCEYITRTGNQNTITCGMDMYNQIGYSGYFENGHPCQSMLSEFENKYKKI